MDREKLVSSPEDMELSKESIFTRALWLPREHFSSLFYETKEEGMRNLRWGS